ncbi:hypothetical protein E2P81_ATG06903 [Venturia nashicola]|nr:hypothetical protein E2P81_ATG06903 [Venturia nashicola]
MSLSVTPGLDEMGLDGIGWDGIGWDWMGWDAIGWDGMRWDGIGWDGMGCDGMGWDGGMRWDAMGCDGMPWVEDAILAIGGFVLLSLIQRFTRVMTLPVAEICQQHSKSIRIAAPPGQPQDSHRTATGQPHLQARTTRSEALGRPCLHCECVTKIRPRMANTIRTEGGSCLALESITSALSNHQRAAWSKPGRYVDKVSKRTGTTAKHEEKAPRDSAVRPLGFIRCSVEGKPTVGMEMIVRGQSHIRSQCGWFES